jgi:hypothetical protein
MKTNHPNYEKSFEDIVEKREREKMFPGANTAILD